MKKIVYSLILMQLFLTIVAGCGKFGSINRDPNNPSSTDNRYIFMDASRYVANMFIVGTYNPFPQHWVHYWAERQNVQYTVMNLDTWTVNTYYYRPLKDLASIIETNTDPETKAQSWVTNLGSNANQIAVAKTLTAFFYMHMTDALGMIPYSEALKANEGNYTPKYDTQEFIYADLEKELNDAYAMFDNNGPFSSQFDIFYGGDMNKWKKFNASIRMLMAIKMDKVDPTNGRARFAKAYQDGGIMNNADNFNYKYLPENNNSNPLYDNIFVTRRDDFAPCLTFMDTLKAFSDPRLYAYCTPNREGDYVGVPFGMIASDLSASGLSNLASSFTSRFTAQDAVGTLTCASQMLLHAAEAAILGWIDMDPFDLYRRGIEASFELNNIALSEVAVYMNQPRVQLIAGETEDNIKKISLQKWIQGFGQDCFEAWSEWRRHRIPDLRIGPAAGASLDGRPMPDRIRYGTNDYTTNQAAYQEAIALQGPDALFTKVWWNK